MARQFPEIVTYKSAFSFALEVERACADFAAAAEVLAPTDAWQVKLEELVCTHDDRVDKLSRKLQDLDEPLHALEGGAYLETLGSEPATSWPAAAEQVIGAEEDAARYHEAFADACGPLLGDTARAFAKSAKQERAAGQELRAMLG